MLLNFPFTNKSTVGTVVWYYFKETGVLKVRAVPYLPTSVEPPSTSKEKMRISHLCFSSSFLPTEPVRYRSVILLQGDGGTQGTRNFYICRTRPQSTCMEKMRISHLMSLVFYLTAFFYQQNPYGNVRCVIFLLVCSFNGFAVRYLCTSVEPLSTCWKI